LLVRQRGAPGRRRQALAAAAPIVLIGRGTTREALFVPRRHAAARARLANEGDSVSPASRGVPPQRPIEHWYP